MAKIELVPVVNKKQTAFIVLLSIVCWLSLFFNALAKKEEVEATTVTETYYDDEDVQAPATSHYYYNLTSDSAKIDPKPLEKKSLSQSNLKKYKEDSDYDYFDEVKTTGESSFFSGFWRAIGEFLRNIFPSISPRTIEAFIRILCYIILVVTVLWVIIKLSGVTYGSIFTKSTGRKLSTKTLETEENIHELDFDTLIAEALANEQYRRFIRLQYLKTLKELADHQFITWKPDKTNREYQNELKHIGIRKSFQEITHIFNYVWYGDFPASKQLALNSQSLTQQLNQQITTLK